MEQFYLPIKHIHLLLVALTIILFNIRFWLQTLKPHQTLPRLLKILPHLNDTFLLLLGMMLMHIAGWQPFGNAPWLGVKLVLLILYIFLGALALKNTPRSTRSYFAYIAAMSVIAVMIYLARVKPF